MLVGWPRLCVGDLVVVFGAFPEKVNLRLKKDGDDFYQFGPEVYVCFCECLSVEFCVAVG